VLQQMLQMVATKCLHSQPQPWSQLAENFKLAKLAKLDKLASH
jgi:hypothetical protein